MLLRLAFLMDCASTAESGLHMILEGEDNDGKCKTIRFFLIARSGHGPYVPCMPAIILARRLALGQIDRFGAYPCLDLIALPEYLEALAPLDIEIVTEGDDAAL